MNDEVIQGSSFPECWLKAAKIISSPSTTEASPILVKIKLGSVQPDYQESFEHDLDKLLRKKNLVSTNTTASTIFPNSLDSGGLSVFDRFDNIWKQISKCPKNRRGHYFRRLSSFGRPDNYVNQLEHVISTYQNGNHRRSALIATVFDPTQDHTNEPYAPFPCLHQVCFVPKPSEGTLSINATYAMQYLFDRAYGNYVGLSWLGSFVGREMGLQLDEVNCFASVLGMGHISKGELRGLVEKYEEQLPI